MRIHVWLWKLKVKSWNYYEMRQGANAACAVEMEHWGNMEKFALYNDKSSGCVLNSLQLVNMALRYTISSHHHHRSAAEQATTSFLQPQRSCANSDSLPRPIMLSVSPKRCWMYLINRVPCLPGFLFPCGGICIYHGLCNFFFGVLHGMLFCCFRH